MRVPEAFYQACLPLFDGARTAMARDMLLGAAPCHVFADRMDAPRAALVCARRIGYACVAGDPGLGAPLLEALRPLFPWVECIAMDPAWHPALAGYSKQSHAIVRYALDASALDRQHLRRLARIPAGYTIERYEAETLRQVCAQPWGEDQIGLYASQQDFLRDSGGMVLLESSSPIGGCAGFCRQGGEDEIQVDLHPQYRGKGLASCLCAAYLLDALAAGRKPRWDAANVRSLRLAEKLGFRLVESYPAWCLLSPDADVRQAYAQMGPDVGA